MRFLVDECTGPTVAHWLREQGHEVFSVYDDARGIDDDQIIQKASLRTGFSLRMTRTSVQESIENTNHIEALFFLDSEMSEQVTR